jgi:hypothetical protein
VTAGLIVDGRRVPVPGVRVVTWEDDPRVPRAVHGAMRSASDVSGSIVHTSRGKDARITRATGSPTKGLKVARYLGRRNTREVSAHLVVAGDGTVYQVADLATWHCNHAGQVNGFTVGVEVAQDDGDPSLTEAQVKAFVAMMHVVHAALKIPMRVPMRGREHVSDDVKPWLRKRDGGAEHRFAGCVGHRNTSTSRGRGDPGDALMEALHQSGFAGVLPDAMDCLGGVCADEERLEGDDDAPQEWPPAPSWLDLAREVDADIDAPKDPQRFVATLAPVLATLGVTGSRAVELIAHAAVETGWRLPEHHNLGGAKARERDFVAAKVAGRPLAWWRDLGHRDSGDDEVEYYRAFDSYADFWRWFLARHTGAGPTIAPSSERYALVGPAFWSARPDQWFVELLRAGYRGSVRQAEIRALRDPETHPSVVAHRRVVERVRGLLP